MKKEQQLIILVILALIASSCAGKAPDPITWGGSEQGTDFNSVDTNPDVSAIDADKALAEKIKSEFVDIKIETNSCGDWEKFRHVWNIGIIDAYKVNSLVDESFSEAQNSGLSGEHNGLQDAFRHCYWSCKMAQEIGGEHAQSVGETHEACSAEQPAEERKMDLINNSIGRALADKGSCKDSCMEFANNGLLVTITPAP
jgi:hypothetical protein